jgi:hypothetical protein
MKKLIAVRKQHRALRIGNFRLLGAGKLFAFERYTDRIQDAVVVIANPSKAAITEIVLVPDSKLMSDVVTLANLLDPSAKPVPINSAMLTVTVPADSVLVLAPDMRLKDGYTPYKRIQ